MNINGWPMAHPFAALLYDRDVRILWLGLALSAIGDALFGFGAIWLAVQMAGRDAVLLPAANYAASLVISVVSSALPERTSLRSVMIGADIIRAFVCVVPVVVAMTWGLTLPVLIMASICLAGLRALFDPALLSSIPQLAGGEERIRATNALIDATSRFARLSGPFLAGFLVLFVPVIHLLTANAVSFVASAFAILLISARLRQPSAGAGASPTTALRRMQKGFCVSNRTRGVWPLLVANTIILGAWTLGLVIGFPLMISERPPTSGLSAIQQLVLVLGFYGAGDFLSNIAVASIKPLKPWRFMFLGYVILGAGIAACAMASVLLPSEVQLAAMVLAAFIAGLGGPMFFIQMMTFFQTRLNADDLTSVLRLRISLTAAAMMVASLAGSWLLQSIGTVPSVVTCGVIILAVGCAGTVCASWRGRDALSEAL
jgi:hypothetical protein